MKRSGKKHAPVRSAIFSRTRLTLGPMSMGAQALTQHAGLLSILGVGMSVNQLTSGKFACTIDIQRIFRGQSSSPIKTRCAPTIWTIRRIITACEASDRPYCKASCAVDGVAHYSICATRVHTVNFQSTSAAMTSTSFWVHAERRVRAIALDTQVEQIFLEALRPDQLAVGLAARGQVGQQ